MAVSDYGGPTDTLASPSLSAWAGSVAGALAGTASGSVTPSTGWVAYGGAYGGLQCTRVGLLVVLDGVAKRVGSFAVTAGAEYQIGTVPVGFRPAFVRVVWTGMTILTNVAPYPGPGSPCRLRLDQDGTLLFTAPTTGTMVDGSWVSFQLAYRGA